MIRQLKFFAFLLFVSLLSACSTDQDVVNVYSGRHYQVDENLFREFTQQTGIRVNLVKADTDQLINRLELEGSNTQADVFITADAGRMILCKEKGLLQPMNMETLANVVPANLRDADNYWTGFTQRARVIVYQKTRVDPSMLSTYEDLVLPQWQGRVLVRSSQNHYNQTLMASIIAAHGDDAAREWARGLVSNMAQPPKGNDRDQVKAIAAGIGDVAIVNTYYMGLLLHSTNTEERNIAGQMGIFFPNQQDRGTHINISGIAITAHASNAENAQKLVEFLLQPQAQKAFAEESFEYPVNANVEWTPLFNEWGTFKADPLPLDELGKHLSRATILFNEAGWN
jgi:iron(III) transport system substrate-binding protein